MTEESLTIRVGYNPLTMKFFVNGSLVIFAFIIVLYLMSAYSLIPLLFVSGCMMTEIRWRMRKNIAIILSGKDSGLQYGKSHISWESIKKYNSWGPIGIPLTPFRYKGISLSLDREKDIHLNSTYRGFDEILELLQKKKIPKYSSEASWYNYPTVVTRSLCYITAFVFCILFSVFLSFSLLIIPIAYFIYKRKKATDKKDGLAEDTWITVLAGIAFLLMSFYLLQNSFLMTLICFVPTVAILWFPWKNNPLCIEKETLFVGKKQAYPLRHLRTVKTISKYLILRYQRLSFVNGDVDVYPYLQNFDLFKQNLDDKWSDVQKKYQGKAMSEEDALILSPEEEALRIGVPPMPKTKKTNVKTTTDSKINDINEVSDINNSNETKNIDNTNTVEVEKAKDAEEIN